MKREMDCVEKLKRILEFLWSLPPQDEEIEYRIQRNILVAEYLLEQHGVDPWEVV